MIISVIIPVSPLKAGKRISVLIPLEVHSKSGRGPRLKNHGRTIGQELITQNGGDPDATRPSPD